jgi:hypothetical protein
MGFFLDVSRDCCEHFYRDEPVAVKSPNKPAAAGV